MLMINIEQIDQVESYSYRYSFPTIDFKFQNAGSVTAFLWQFTVSILRASVDVTPMLTFAGKVEDGDLLVEVTNNGWGAAHDFQFQINEPTLNQIFEDSVRQYQGVIRSGERQVILRLSTDLAISHWFEVIRYKFMPCKPDDQHPRAMDSYKLSSPTSLQGIEITSIEAVYKFKDEHGVEHHSSNGFSINGLSMFTLTSNGTFLERHLTHMGVAESDTTYVVVVDPLKGTHKRKYSISRKIPPGDIERFHIMIVSRMSCQLQIKFIFNVDKAKVVESEEFDVSIWNSRNSQLHFPYKDSTKLVRARKNTFGDRRLKIPEAMRRRSMGWLGIGLADRILKQERGVLVDSVRPKTPAELAGIQSGDVIIEFNGHTIEGRIDLLDRIIKTPPGITVKLKVLRGGQEKMINAKMGRRN
jgi:PDZ domain